MKVSDPSGARPWWKLGTFASLRHRSYLYLWLSIVFSSAVFWMEQVAVGWLVYDMTGSPFLAGAIAGARSLPYLVIGPIGGVVADRFDRKTVMLWSQVVILGFYLALTTLLMLDRIEVWHFFAFTLGSALAWAFNQPSRHAMLPMLVPKEDIVNAVALQTMAHNLTRVVGPTIGGTLLASLGPQQTFLIVTLGLVGVLACTAVIQQPAGLQDNRPRAEGSVWTHLLEGLAYVRGEPTISALLILAMIPIVFGMSYMALMPVFARDVFGRDAVAVGELLGVSGIGSLAATLLLASVQGDFPAKGKVLLGSGLGLGVALIAFAMSPSYLVALIMLAVTGLLSMTQIVLTNASIQTLVPQQYMGRVMSLYMLDRGLMPIGSFAAGAMAEVFGAPIAMAALGWLCFALMAVGTLAMPHIARLK